MRAALFLVLLAGCGGGTEPEPETTDRDRYFEASCRLFVEEACVTSSDNTCGGSISFDSVSDCEFFLRLGACSELTDAMQGNADVLACITELEAFDCATEDVCDGNQDYTAGGAACRAVEALTETTCPEDSGF